MLGSVDIWIQTVPKNINDPYMYTDVYQFNSHDDTEEYFWKTPLMLKAKHTTCYVASEQCIDVFSMLLKQKWVLCL